jgi:hypothetical protein
MLFVGWRDFAKEYQRRWFSIYLVPDLQDVIFARELQIWFLVCP